MAPSTYSEIVSCSPAVVAIFSGSEVIVRPVAMVVRGEPWKVAVRCRSPSVRPVRWSGLVPYWFESRIRRLRPPVLSRIVCRIVW